MGSYHKKCVQFSTWKSNIDFHFLILTVCLRVLWVRINIYYLIKFTNQHNYNRIYKLKHFFYKKKTN